MQHRVNGDVTFLLNSVQKNLAIVNCSHSASYNSPSGPVRQ